MLKQDLKNTLGTATYQMVRWIEAVPVREYTEFTARLSFDNVATLMACDTPEGKKVHALCVAYFGHNPWERSGKEEKLGDGKPMLGYQLYDRDAAANNMSADSVVKGCEFHGGFTDVEKFLYALENDIAEYDATTDAPVDEVLRFQSFKKLYEKRK
jgi:hypothetical protein